MTAVWRQAIAELQASPPFGRVLSGQDPRSPAGGPFGAAPCTSPFPPRIPIPVPRPGASGEPDSPMTIRDS
jgi:hypothetical protein